MATIVVAEDERDLNNLIRRHLEDENYTVVQAFDGADAVLAVGRDRPDLLILDEPFNELDENSELEMLRQLQTIASGGKMVLLITHNSEALSFCNRKIFMDAEG